MSFFVGMYICHYACYTISYNVACYTQDALYFFLGVTKIDHVLKYFYF